MSHNFADLLHESTRRSRTYLCAGMDPSLESIPSFILEEASRTSTNDEQFAYQALRLFHFSALDVLAEKVAAIKPNIAFFEQYGIGGLRAFADICSAARERQIPVIADIKRGDIASTGQAYSSAFLSGAKIQGRTVCPFAVDAITLNPFLGFDTVEVFLKDAQQHGKGLFVLVRTSNPGAPDLQSTTSEKVASFLASQADSLRGSCGYSSLGAVIGATYPAEAQHFRSLMPTSMFLIPGFGAQGGSANDAMAGIETGKKGGIVVNSSRGIFGSIPAAVTNYHQLNELLLERISTAAQSLSYLGD